MNDSEINLESIEKKSTYHLEKYEFHPHDLKFWHRKRLEPLLKKLLYPTCWSLLILGIGILFTLLDHRTNFSEFIGAILLFTGPLVLGLSIIYISNYHDNPRPHLVVYGLVINTRMIWLFISIGLLCIGIVFKPANTMFWNLMIIPNVILWIEWLAFGSFYFSSPSAIWIVHYDPSKNLPMDKLSESGWKWASESLKPLNTVIAYKKNKESTMELSSFKDDNSYYFSLEWWQKGGIRQDPFVEKEIRGLAIPSLTQFLGYNLSEFDVNSLRGIEYLEKYYIKK